MITITQSNDKEKCFNLKNYEREKALYNAWFSMSDEIKYADKKLKITTDTGEILNLKISEIKDCKLEDCVFCANPEVKNIEDKEKKSKKEPNIMDQLDVVQKKREEENVRYFFSVLQRRNVTYNLNDPALLQILKNVKKDTDKSKWKLDLYANMYINMKPGR